MSEAMNENVENTQAETMGKESAEQGTGKDSKLFTQDEVNSFVQSRISRMKGQIEKESKTAYETKLAELETRERKLMVKEALHDRNMPAELADIITCTDENDLTTKLEALNKIYGGIAKKENSQPTGFIQVGAPAGSGFQTTVADPVRKAMGLE